MKPQTLLLGAVLLVLMVGAATGCSASSQAAPPGDEGAPEAAFPTPTGAASDAQGEPASSSTDAPQGPEEPGTPPADVGLPISPTIPLPTEVPVLAVTQQPEVDLMNQDEAVALAKQTLAQHLDIPPEEVEVIWASRATWRDSSLGCPQKGVAYLPVITPGYLILLQTGGQSYEVHVGGEAAVVCSELRTPPALERIPNAGRAYEMARQDLADRLDVSVEEIQARLIRPTTWPDGSLGCSTAGESYPPGPIEGYIVELEFEGRIYEYHSDGERVVLCKE